jgi:hypothetical protein
MMKFSITSVGAAVGLALISASANAALSPPAQNLTSAPTSTGLYLAVYDSGSNASEIVNLSYDQSAITAASGNLTPNAANGAFVQTAAPTGTGTVLQLNFGQISGFSGTGAIFNSANEATTNFMVIDAISGGAGTEAFQATGTSTPVTAYGGVNTVVQSIQGEIAGWQGAAPTSGDLKDTTGVPVYSVQTGPLASGELVSGQFFTGGLNTAVNFYDVTTTAAHKSVVTQYANATGAGYWFLSSSGDLTYNVPTAGVAPVPLPAAVWLLGSGLLGLAGIGRRRNAA